jgi:hypothetical protein
MISTSFYAGVHTRAQSVIQAFSSHLRLPFNPLLLYSHPSLDPRKWALHKASILKAFLFFMKGFEHDAIAVVLFRAELLMCQLKGREEVSIRIVMFHVVHLFYLLK